METLKSILVQISHKFESSPANERYNFKEIVTDNIE
jgi:hypothetical protein